jgi:hypothetical protein
MRSAVSLLFVCFVCGCESSSEFLHPDATIPRVQSQNQMFPPVDTFWLQQEIAHRREQAEADQERPVRHSISLGYAGDTPLSGGMMNSATQQYSYSRSYSRGGPYR